MTFIAFLNELSFPAGPLDEAAARTAIRGLIATLRSLRNVHASAALHSSVPLPEIPLGDEAWLGTLLSGGEWLDEWRYLRGFENRAPFRVGLGETFGLESEYRHQGAVAEGLGLAHALGTLGISLGYEPWIRPTIELDHIFLRDDGGSDQDKVEVAHATLPDHVQVHDEWLRRTPLASIVDGDALWERRDEVFPHLRFLPRTEGHLRILKAGELRFRSAANGLMDLELAVASWSTANDPLPTFRSKVTPEHEMRRKKFLFDDLSGVKRHFDLHSRFTPGAGRIHFWCDRATGLAQIAHVGEKVPD